MKNDEHDFMGVVKRLIGILVISFVIAYFLYTIQPHLQPKPQHQIDCHRFPLQ